MPLGLFELELLPLLRRHQLILDFFHELRNLFGIAVDSLLGSLVFLGNFLLLRLIFLDLTGQLGLFAWDHKSTVLDHAQEVVGQVERVVRAGLKPLIHIKETLEVVKL
jgi:hypothetical protein